MQNKSMTFRDIQPELRSRFLYLVLTLFDKCTKIILAIIYANVLKKTDTVNGMSLFLIGVLTVATIIIFSFVGYQLRRMESEDSHVLLEKTQEKIFLTIENKDIAKMESLDEGRWNSVISEDTEACSNYYFTYKIPFVSGILLFFVAIGVGFYLSPILTFVILLCSCVSVYLPKLYLNRINQAQECKLQKKDSLRNETIKPLYFKDLINAYDYNEQCCEIYNQTYLEYAKESMVEASLSAVVRGLNTSVSFTITTVWMVIGAFLISAGIVNVGIFAAFMMLNDYFNWPFTDLGDLLSIREQIRVSLNRIKAILEMEDAVPEYVVKSNQNQIRIESIGFSREFYHLSSDKIEFPYENGSFTAMIGDSGSGKTTLMKLMLGAYHPTSGMIQVCSQEVSERTSLFDFAGCLFQDYVIFHDTVENNITMGDDQLSDQEFENLISVAGLIEVIQSLPDGKRTMIGHGSSVSLSRGQIARIALARILARKRKIYFLDEFSASLDETLECKILENLKKLDATFFLITHREESIKRCDQIMAIDPVKMDEASLYQVKMLGHT